MSLGQKADDFAFDNLVIDDTPSPKTLLQLVASGRLDYGIFYLATGKQEIKRNHLSSRVKILPHPVSKEGLYIAYSKNSQCQQQISKLNDEIHRMKKDGSIESIIQYYHAFVAMKVRERADEN
jgi:polar amino acid transport system substrate-binding protein